MLTKIIPFKDNILLFFMLFSFAFFLSSCETDESKDQKERKISFWHFWSEPNQQEALNQIIEQFEKEYDCKVETTELSWNDGKTKLFAAFNSKTAPDVLELGSDWVAQFSSAGVLQRIDQDSIPTSRYVKFSLEPSYWDNTFYAVPWLVDTRVLFYNIDLMKKSGLDTIPPRSISEMIKYSKKISTIKDVYGFGCNGSDPHRLYKKILYFFWSFGGGIFNQSGEPMINSKENINALETYVKLSNYGIVETQRQIDALFARGQIGLWISGGWLLEKIKNENPGLNFGVALLPGLENEPGISFAGGEYLSISRQSENYELAIQFIDYMTNGKNAIRFCKKIIEAGFPADKNYYNDDYYKTKPKRELFSRQLEHARMTPVSPRWLDIESIIEKAAVEALYGKRSATKALNEAQSSVVKLLKNK